MSVLTFRDRVLPPLLLDDWLDNWGRWLGADIVPTISLSDVGEFYDSPERNHHETPEARAQYVKPLAIYEDAARLVERQVHASTFEQRWLAALRATFYLWPVDRLRADHVPPERWTGRRAHAADQAAPTYLESLADAKKRLARDLYVWRHSMPMAA